jgi:hypothetical protein
MTSTLSTCQVIDNSDMWARNAVLGDQCREVGLLPGESIHRLIGINLGTINRRRWGKAGCPLAPQFGHICRSATQETIHVNRWERTVTALS